MTEKKEIKQNIIVSYLKSAIDELKQVKWPTRKETINHTILVIAICLFMAVFLGLLDFGLTTLLQNILKITK